jgi:predicted DNA-binding mobile mystery protein A
MNKAQQSSRARQALDEKFRSQPDLRRLIAPPRGWIKAIRMALGMSYRQLAQRLNVREPTVVGMERSEAKATIQLATLRRVAEALDCTLVYALVPNATLEETVRKRARQVARKQLQAVSHTMRLEKQSVDQHALDRQIDLLAREINPRVLWDD